MRFLPPSRVLWRVPREVQAQTRELDAVAEDGAVGLFPATAVGTRRTVRSTVPKRQLPSTRRGGGGAAVGAQVALALWPVAGTETPAASPGPPLAPMVPSPGTSIGSEEGTVGSSRGRPAPAPASPTFGTKGSKGFRGRVTPRGGRVAGEEIHCHLQRHSGTSRTRDVSPRGRLLLPSQGPGERSRTPFPSATTGA